MRKIQDPNLSPAARQALIQDMLKAQEGTLAKMKDPNGQMSCSEKVGRRIALTGAMARR